MSGAGEELELAWGLQSLSWLLVSLNSCPIFIILHHPVSDIDDGRERESVFTSGEGYATLATALGLPC